MTFWGGLRRRRLSAYPENFVIEGRRWCSSALHFYGVTGEDESRLAAGTRLIVASFSIARALHSLARGAEPSSSRVIHQILQSLTSTALLAELIEARLIRCLVLSTMITSPLCTIPPIAHMHGRRKKKHYRIHPSSTNHHGHPRHLHKTKSVNDPLVSISHAAKRSVPQRTQLAKPSKASRRWRDEARNKKKERTYRSD